MRSLLRFVNLCIVLAMLVGILLPGQATGSTVESSPDRSSVAEPSAPYVEGEAVVRFKAGVTVDKFPSLVKQVQAQAVVARTMKGDTRTVLVRFPKTLPVEEVVGQFKSRANVASAEPNYIAAAPDWAPVTHQAPTDKVQIDALTLNGTYTTAELSTDQLRAAGVAPSDPDLGNQWGWDYIGANVIWPEAAASPVVAVIDSGVDFQHPDLSGRIIKGYDFINDDASPMDDYGQGTHVAGVIAAKLDNATGIAGVANSQVLAVKVLNARGLGTYFDVAQGIRAAADNSSVRVINLSLGGIMPGDTLYNAVDYAVNAKGKLVVAAAGNANSTNALYPAYYATVWPGKVIAVASNGAWIQGSTTGEWYWYEHCKSDFSNYGAWVTLAAPGQGIYSTTPFDRPFYLHQYKGVPMRYAHLSGTGMATPFVAATAARTWSLHPAWTNLQVGEYLVTKNKPYVGFPLNVVGQSVDADKDGTPDALCWPSAMNSTFGAAFVARTMQRERIIGRIYDAMTGLPLKGAQALAYAGLAAKGYGGKVESPELPDYQIINLPRAFEYTMKVDRTGYTAGPQAFAKSPIPNNLEEDCPICTTWVVNRVSVPTNKNNVLVTDWRADWPADYGLVDLDNMLWLPPGPNECIIGNGALLAPNGCGGPGTLYGSFPLARWMRDGGPWDVGSEATSIKGFFPTNQGPYSFYVWEVNPGDGYGFWSATPVVRYWRAGVIKKIVNAYEGTPGGDYTCKAFGGSQSCSFWYVGDLNSAGALTVKNQLIDPHLTPLPYVGPAGIIKSQGSPSKPGP